MEHNFALCCSKCYLKTKRVFFQNHIFRTSNRAFSKTIESITFQVAVCEKTYCLSCDRRVFQCFRSFFTTLFQLKNLIAIVLLNNFTINFFSNCNFIKNYYLKDLQLHDSNKI